MTLIIEYNKNKRYPFAEIEPIFLHLSAYIIYFKSEKLFMNSFIITIDEE